MTTTQALRTGYRGSKVHAVDIDTLTNRANLRNGGEWAISLCKWEVRTGGEYGEEFVPNMLACKTCAKMAEKR